jgi:hypothetical protein
MEARRPDADDVGTLSMRLERTIEIEGTAEACAERVRSFLEAVGYAEERGAPLRFARGSALGSLTAVGPRSWGARATLALDEAAGGGRTRLGMVLEVNTFGQIVTGRDRDYWNDELEALALAARTGDLQVRALGERHAEVVRAGWTKMGIIAAVALVVAVPVTLILSGRVAHNVLMGTLAGVVVGCAVAFGGRR